MNPTRVLLTGANGFMGRALLRRLAARPCTIVSGLVRSEAKADVVRALGGRAFVGDITEPASVGPAMREQDAVVHLAAWVGEHGPAADIERTNIEGTRNVVRAAADAGVRRFVHTSSVAVYGAPDAMDIDERWPTRRTGHVYRDSKIRAEEAARSESTDMVRVILRPSHVYGPESDHFTIRPIRMLLRRRAFLVGGGRAYFKPLYIDNFVDAALLALEAAVEDGVAYNLSDGDVRTWRELFEAYARLLGRPPRLPSVPVPVALAVGYAIHQASAIRGRKPFFSHRSVNTLTSRNSYSAARAQRELGWTPRIDFDDGMRYIVVSRCGRGPQSDLSASRQ